jgi:hypothetical protein
MRVLTNGDAAILGKSVSELEGIALNNLITVVQSNAVFADTEWDGVYQFILDGKHDAASFCLLAVAQYFQVQYKVQSVEILLLAQDVVFYSSGFSTAVLQNIRNTYESINDRVRPRVSDYVYALSEGNWYPYAQLFGVAVGK